MRRTNRNVILYYYGMYKLSLSFFSKVCGTKDSYNISSRLGSSHGLFASLIGGRTRQYFVSRSKSNLDGTSFSSYARSK